jgi:hypothetical protein
MQAYAIGAAFAFAVMGITSWSMKADRWSYFSEPMIWLRAFAITWPAAAIMTALISARFTWHYNRWFWLCLAVPGIAAPLLLFVDGF